MSTAADSITTVAATATAAWLARDHDALAGVLPRYYDVVAERGEGSWLVDVDGRRCLDLGAGIAVNTTGHGHPRGVDAITQQARPPVHPPGGGHQHANVPLAQRIGGPGPRPPGRAPPTPAQRRDQDRL